MCHSYIYFLAEDDREKRAASYKGDEILFIHEASVSSSSSGNSRSTVGKHGSPPHKVISKEDGKRAVEYTQGVFKTCKKLL